MTAWSPVRYAHNREVAVAYSVAGRGDLDLLVIGGFVSHLEIGPTLPLMARFWERMASFARVIAFDKRGMGLSDRDAGAYTLENIADDALAVLDEVGVERAAVFGVSEGGAAATMLAALHPDRVSAMVQYGTYARVSRSPDYPEGLRPARLRDFWEGVRDNWGDPAGIDVWGPSRATRGQRR